MAGQDFFDDESGEAFFDDAPKPSLAQQAFQYGLKGLDYGAGLARTELFRKAHLLKALIDGKKTAPAGLDEKDARALRGEAPTSAEQLEDLGLGQLGSLSDVMPKLFNETGQGLKLQRGIRCLFRLRPVLVVVLHLRKRPLDKGVRRITAGDVANALQDLPLAKRSVARLGVDPQHHHLG